MMNLRGVAQHRERTRAVLSNAVARQENVNAIDRALIEREVVIRSVERRLS
jgi:hypothetical protein